MSTVCRTSGPRRVAAGALYWTSGDCAGVVFAVRPLRGRAHLAQHALATRSGPNVANATNSCCHTTIKRGLRTLTSSAGLGLCDAAGSPQAHIGSQARALSLSPQGASDGLSLTSALCLVLVLVR